LDTSQLTKIFEGTLPYPWRYWLGDPSSAVMSLSSGDHCYLCIWRL